MPYPPIEIDTCGGAACALVDKSVIASGAATTRMSTLAAAPERTERRGARAGRSRRFTLVHRTP
jgi:hypothetical protein